MAAMMVPEIAGLLKILEDVKTDTTNPDVPATSVDILEGSRKDLLKEGRHQIEISQDLAKATVLHPAFNNLCFYSSMTFHDEILAKIRLEYEALLSSSFTRRTGSKFVPYKRRCT
ncbi:hypothetical protein BGZ99_001910 [Dissophora globulifera]|uniref:Uncharacterized protein n=1 Tax=Dissophora globulifera TaxID=979702 RepID=A0A9P6UWN8_9FUNG|nr:hypothetical protein BGZ99_001910 [Dissophora globulifera]